MISTEKETILRLKSVYDKIIHTRSEEIESSSWVSLSEARRANLSRTDRANFETLSAHGTNGFAILLAVLTGKQLLPSNEREKRGIPTITGEAKYKTKKESNSIYHNEWQNFVSTVYLQSSNPDIDTLNGYSNASQGKFSYSYDDFKKKFNKIYREILIGEELDKLPNDGIMKQLYGKLSNMRIIAIGDGVGYAESINSMDCEKKYERVNIRAIVIPDEHVGFFQDLFSTVDTQDIAIITQSEFRKFCRSREQSRQKMFGSIDAFVENFRDLEIKNLLQNAGLEMFAKAFGYNGAEDFAEKFGNTKLGKFFDSHDNYIKLASFSEDFIKVFGDKFSCHFYSSSDKVTIEKEMKYKNGDKSFTTKGVQIKYSISPNTEIIPESVVVVFDGQSR